MTEYQRKRQFLSKINARTRSMAKKYGIDRKTIAERAIDGFDGVYVDEKFGTINITKGFESEELYKILDKNVLTNTQAEAKALKVYENYPEPLSEDEVKDEVRSMFSFEKDIDDIVKSYYNIEASLKQRPWDDKNNEAFKKFDDKLTELGHQWHDEMPYSILQGLLAEAKMLKGNINLEATLNENPR